MNKFFIYARPCVNKDFFHDDVFSCVFVSFPKYPKIDGNDEKLSRVFLKFSFVLATQPNSKSGESSRFPLEQGESFSDLSRLTCARRAVQTSPCNERTWDAQGTDTIMTSPEREPPKTSTKRSAALRSPTGSTLASPQTSFQVRLSRIHFSPTDVC